MHKNRENEWHHHKNEEYSGEHANKIVEIDEIGIHIEACIFSKVNLHIVYCQWLYVLEVLIYFSLLYTLKIEEVVLYV